jgi:hypothetical protein
VLHLRRRAEEEARISLQARSEPLNLERSVGRPLAHSGLLVFNSGTRIFDISAAPAARVLTGEEMRIAMRSRRATAWFFALALAGALTACSGMRIISDYDEPTDKALTTLQASADDFIAKLAKDAPSDKNGFDKHQAFYDEADQQLRRLEFRASSVPKNEKTVKLIADIRRILLGEGKCDATGTSLRDLHCLPASKASGPSKQSLELASRNVNQTIGAALALEIAKKQGQEQNK